MTRLSIITVNLNNRQGLKRTLKSVASQSYKNVELILVDGGSSDGSQELFPQYQTIITRVVSEPDRGIYHAMNKGIGMACGEYLLFLNSGDWLAENDVLERVFSDFPDTDIVAGDIDYIDPATSRVRWHVESPDLLTAATLFHGSLPHQATFIRSHLFAKHGLYNEELTIASDWKFFLEVLLEKHATYARFRGTVACFMLDGLSSRPETCGLPQQEQRFVLGQKFPRFLTDYDRLKALDDERVQWQNSREFHAFRILKKTGVVSAMILLIRVSNRLRKIFKTK